MSYNRFSLAYEEQEIRYCRRCGSYSEQPHHSHECRDCGADINCHATDDVYGNCSEWEGGNDRCPNPHCETERPY